MEEHRPKKLLDQVRDATHLIGCLSGTHTLMAKLIYRSGVRLMECLRSRVKDRKFARRALIVRDGKGAQNRVTMLPDSLIPLLKEHLPADARVPARGCPRSAVERGQPKFSVLHHDQGQKRILYVVARDPWYGYGKALRWAVRGRGHNLRQSRRPVRDL